MNKYLSPLAVFYLVCVLLFISCKNNTTLNNFETIDVDPNLKVDKKCEFEIDTIIHLQTSEESLIGDIMKVEFYAGHFYILDKNISRTVYVFDKNGGFINKTIIGKGPGEINQPSGFEIDRVKNQIIVWDEFRNEDVFFDLNLKFIERKRYQGIIRSYLSINDTTRLAFVRSCNPKYFLSDKKDIIFYNYFVYSNGFSNIQKELFPLSAELSSLDVSIPFSKFKDRVLFFCLYDYNIYGLNGLEPEVLYEIDFGKYGLETSDIEKGHDYIWKNFYDNKKIITLNKIFENSTSLSFSFTFSRESNYCIYSKKSQNVCLLNSTNKYNLPGLDIVGIYLDDYFIGSVNYENMKKYYEQSNLYSEAESLSISDNQSLIIFKMIE